jgi:hypothetical protein
MVLPVRFSHIPAMRVFPRLLAVALAAAFLLQNSSRAAVEYLTGGPLAGLKLPVSPQNTGPGPEVELYPGAAEHWRGYMMKYLPMRSFFDQQSQLKFWKAADLAAGKTENYVSPVYSQPDNGNATDTGKRLPPVPVVRCRAGDAPFKLDLGELDVGLYAVRVIGTAETAKLRRFREPLYLRMSVNDGPNGEATASRIRTSYVDEFYSVGTFYFHALAKRRFTAELAVDRGTTVEILVQGVSLDDVLAGTTRRALKTRRSLYLHELTEARDASLLLDEREDGKEGAEGKAPGGAAAPPKPAAKTKVWPAALSPAERLARDEAIWNWLPPLNTAHSRSDAKWGTAELGVADKTLAQVEAEHGAWENAGGRETLNVDAFGLTRDPKLQRALLVNKKLNLEYTMDDLRARKALPDPFPFKDDGAGLFFPDPSNPEKGRVYAPIAAAIGRRIRNSTAPAALAIRLWLESKNPDFARDGAVALVRYAFQFPSIEGSDGLDTLTCIPQYQGRDYWARQREQYAFWQAGYTNYDLAIQDYDMLFDYIKGNEELAKSIGRFIPWVKTSEDVIQLLDTYLVQTTAKRILRYHYISKPAAITDLAITLGDRGVTDPWMDWQFSRTFIYPLAPAGLQDLMISGCDREGPQYIGSTFYSQGEGAIRLIEGIERYIAAGGDPKRSLSDPATFPKPLAQAHWQINTIVGGADFARIGDVCGPDKAPFSTATQYLELHSRDGWRLSQDPRFAWILANVFGRKLEPAAEWAKITAAAPTVKRAPWLDLPTRHVENWFAVLETGLPHDDFRFRRAAYLRTGVGHGHAHCDALDLQFVAFGMPMTVDGGQRSGYSKPNDRFTRTHNVVEVARAERVADDFGHGAYGWPTAVSDAPGAQYVQAASPPPHGAKRYRRQVDLLDVDEGKGSEPLPLELQKPRAKLKPGVTPGSSYLFDVVRVAGGQIHSYGFHGPVNDQFEWNATTPQPVAHQKPAPGSDDTKDAGFLAMFEGAPESKQGGDCPEVFEATWRASREGKIGTEQQMLGTSFDPASPRKFTRLHLLGTTGLRALKADVVTTPQSPVQYRFTHTMAVKRDPSGKQQSAFAAIIEPYAGEPFLASQKLLAVEANENDALRAIAVEVQTKNGRTDLCFADGRPEKVRRLQATSYKLQAAAEFGFLSRDAQGLRLATLTGGTLLETADLKLSVAAREHAAKITKVDYLKKTFWTDQPLPPGCAGRVFEITAPGHSTAYTIASVAAEGAGSRVTVTKGADFHRSRVRKIDPDPLAVVGSLDLPEGRTRVAGMTLSNDDATKTWRVKENSGVRFQVEGAIQEADFAPSGALRLWEYGVGDGVRLPSFLCVRRLDGGGYEVQGDTDAEVTIKGATRKLTASELAAGPVKLP